MKTRAPSIRCVRQKDPVQCFRKSLVQRGLSRFSPSCAEEVPWLPRSPVKKALSSAQPCHPEVDVPDKPQNSGSPFRGIGLGTAPLELRRRSADISSPGKARSPAKRSPRSGLSGLLRTHAAHRGKGGIMHDVHRSPRPGASPGHSPVPEPTASGPTGPGGRSHRSRLGRAESPSRPPCVGFRHRRMSCRGRLLLSSRPVLAARSACGMAQESFRRFAGPGHRSAPRLGHLGRPSRDSAGHS